MTRRKPECSHCAYDLTKLVKDVRVEILCPECGTKALPVPPLMLFGPEYGRLLTRMCLPSWGLAALTVPCLLVSYLFHRDGPRGSGLSVVAKWTASGLCVLVAAAGLLLPLVYVYRISRAPRIGRAGSVLVVWLVLGIGFNAMSLLVASGFALFAGLFADNF